MLEKMKKTILKEAIGKAANQKNAAMKLSWKLGRGYIKANFVPIFSGKVAKSLIQKTAIGFEMLKKGDQQYLRSYILMDTLH